MICRGHKKQRKMIVNKIPLNLQQTLFWTGVEDITNSVVGFYTKHSKTLIIRPEYRDKDVWLISQCSGPVENVIISDGFHVDTWDEKLKEINKIDVTLEE